MDASARTSVARAAYKIRVGQRAAGVRRDDPHLTIPHPRLFERAFALVPLAEIEPAYATARDLLPPDDISAVERIGTFEGEGQPR